MPRLLDLLLRPGFRPVSSLLAGLSLGLAVAGSAHAHGSRQGDIELDHSYAVPTPPGARTGAVYFRALRNHGKVADRLIGASSPVAERVEIHEVSVSGDVARMREQAALDLPPGQTVPLRHDGRHHLMLVGLKRPLVDGDRFDVTLRFERSADATVAVGVQKPRSGSSGGHDHRH